MFEAGLEAIKELSKAIGPALNEHLNALLVQISKKAFDRRLSSIVASTLQVLMIPFISLHYFSLIEMLHMIKKKKRDL